MTKLKKKNILTITAAALLILTAHACRMLSINDICPDELGYVRSFIYLVLFSAWGLSVRNRIIQTQARRFLTAIAALIVFWFLVRSAKFHFVSSEQHPAVTRYLWYLYYLPMLFIPLLAVFIAMFIGKPESYRLPKRTVLLCVPAAVLFLLVLTNDLHQLMFTFPDNAAVRTDKNYGYGMGYSLIVCCLIVCAVSMLIMMLVKCRIPGSRKRILLPCIPICVLLAYMGGYYLRTGWLIFIAGDMTALFCLMYAATLEIRIRCGFIQANTHYMELFDASTVGAQLTDEEYRVFLSSRTAKHFSADLLRQTEKGSVMLEGGLRLSGAPVHGGHVIWSEDMSALMNVLDELREAKEDLEDSNGILEEENAVRAREAHIAEQERLYNIIQRDTAKQISLMDKLIVQAEESGTDENRIRLLKQMLVVGAYLKRRSNLVFLADKMSMLEAKELTLTFGESLDNLEMYGVDCGFRSELTEPVLAVHIMSMYDFFEEITERSLDCMGSLTVYACKRAGELLLIMNTDSAADLSELASETVTVRQDEDGEWQMTLHLSTGGDAQ